MTDVVHSNQMILLFIGAGILVVSTFAVLAVIISMLNYRETPVKDRLLRLQGGEDGKLPNGNAGPFDDLKEALMTFSEPISKSMYGQNVKYMQQIKTLLTEAGLPDHDNHIAKFLTQRVAVGLVLGVFSFLLALVASKGMLVIAIFFLIGGFLAGSLFPQMSLRAKAGKRKTEIRYTMPDTLDLMVVCVEAGLGMDATIQRVAEETERMAPELSHEFKRLNKELNAGISRIEAFQNLGQRAGVDELRSLCAMIIQADKMGTSVADTLRVYADDLRTKRRQKAEELASKASIKMTFPLVFLIFPPLFIILVGPIVINVVNQFFHK